MTNDQLRLLMIHLIRDTDTIRAAAPRLKDEYFDVQAEIVDLVCWRVSRDNFQRTGTATPREHFVPAVFRILDEQFPHSVLDRASIERAVDVAFRFSDKALNHRLIAPLLQEFLLERALRPTVNELVFQGPNAELLEKLFRDTQTAAVSSVRPEDCASLGLDVFNSAAVQPTGFLPLDTLMGGIRLGESTGVLGPMKGGKTSFAQSLVCDVIKLGRRATYLTYEESSAALWQRLLIAFHGRYHRDRIEGKTLAELQKDGELFAALESARQSLAANLTLVDMSGVRGQGFGGVAELEICLEDLARDGRLGSVVVLDHAYAMALAHLNALGADPAKRFRFEIQDIAQRFSVVVQRLNVAGFLLHQVDAAGNRNPVRKPVHTDAAECKLFPQFLHNTICLGVKDEDSAVAWLNLSAARNHAQNAIHVRIDGSRCRVALARGYAVDERTGRFCTTDDLVYGKSLGDEETGDGFRVK